MARVNVTAKNSCKGGEGDSQGSSDGDATGDSMGRCEGDGLIRTVRVRRREVGDQGDSCWLVCRLVC